MRFLQLLASAIILSGISTSANAQFLDRLLDRAERGVKNEIEAKVDREARKATRCALGDKTCIREAKERGEEVEVVRRENTPTPNAPAGNSDVHFPKGAISFADEVVSYSPSIHNAPSRALRGENNILGEPDRLYNNACTSRQSCSLVALGKGGQIELRFTDNILTGSGDERADLMVFGANANAKLSVEISVDGQNWLLLEEIGGGDTGIDLDAFGFGPYTAFPYVRFTDIPSSDNGMNSEGALIDAVGAISTRGI